MKNMENYNEDIQYVPVKYLDVLFAIGYPRPTTIIAIGNTRLKMGNIANREILFQQVFRWFRKEHGLIPTVHVIRELKSLRVGGGFVIKYYYTYTDLSDQSPIGDSGWTTDQDLLHRYYVKHDTYEAAELEALEKLISVVKEKQNPNETLPLQS